MTETVTPVAGSEDTAHEDITDLRSAAKALEGLLDLPPDEPEEDEDEIDARDGDDAAPEKASGEEDGQAEADDQPIVPPKSWTTEDQAKFKELPPDLQAVVSKRENERDRAFNLKTQEVAEERKAVAQAQQQSQMAQQHYYQSLNQLLDATMPELNQLASTDWVRLSREDPSEYVRLQGIKESLVGRARAMQSEMQRVQQANQAQHHAAVEQYKTQQLAELQATVPEFTDPTKAQSLIGDICSTMNGYGFSNDEVGSVLDHRIVRVMTRLAQLEKVEKTRASAQSKKTASPAPKYVTPNASRPAAGKGAQMKEQWSNLRKTGRAEDAARIFEQFLN